MFNHVGNFGYKRGGIEALGFYMFYFGLILIGGFIIGFLLDTFMQGNTIRAAVFLGSAYSILVCTALSLLIITYKKLNTNIPLLILALFSGGLAAFGGTALGLLIPTYLSMKGEFKKVKTPVKKKKRK